MFRNKPETSRERYPELVNMISLPVDKARPWLPPAALAGAQLALGSSWVLLGILAARQTLAPSLAALAWVHLVALGWLTLTALAILFHVIPGFMDVAIPVEGFARGMLWVFMGGVAVLVAGFWSSEPMWIAWGGVALTLGLLGTGVPLSVAVATQAIAQRRARARQGGTRTRNPAAPFVVAFASVFIALLLAAGIGLAMAGGLASWWPAAALALAAVHAHLAAGGWLSLLVMGVSMRTLVRITRVRRSHPILHVAASTGFLAGIAILAIGLAIGAPIVSGAGAVAAALALIAYVVDAGRMLLVSRDPHAVVRAFLGCSLGYLLVTIALGLLVLAGRTDLAPAYAYVALVGWLGQMVVGHLHHIGIRFVITRVRGEDDETEPVEVLSAPLSWTTWATAQAAVALGTAGLVLALAPVVLIAAACGFLSWLALLANAFRAARAARLSPLHP